ncbi:MAG: hypothetical protein U1E77_04840 [Inhella sp.]
MDICPTDCIHGFTANADSVEQFELQVPRLHVEQPLMVSEALRPGA